MVRYTGSFSAEGVKRENPVEHEAIKLDPDQQMLYQKIRINMLYNTGS